MDESNNKTLLNNTKNDTESGDVTEIEDKLWAHDVDDAHFHTPEELQQTIAEGQETGFCQPIKTEPGEDRKEIQSAPEFSQCQSIPGPSVSNPQVASHPTPAIPINPEDLSETDDIIVETQVIRPKTVVKLAPHLTEDRASFPSFRFMNVKIKLGICAASHPNPCLNSSQLQSLAGKIQDLILSPDGRRWRPRFFGVCLRDGMVTMICGDHTTAAWVKELPKKLTADGIRLKIVEKPSDYKTFVAVGHFPKSQGEADARIFRFLEVQNEGLDCSNWRVLDRNYEKFDWQSAQILKAKGPHLNYKFGRARFLLKTKRGVNFREEEDYNYDDEWERDCYENFKQDVAGFRNPYAETKPSNQEFLYFPPDEKNQFPLRLPEGADTLYAARVAAVVEKSKTALRNGFTSRERFMHGMKKGKRHYKKKKKKVKTEPT